MRFHLTLNRTTKQRMLPMDYQYYISAWIYKTIGKADMEFARFLHDEGYGNDPGKLYKLFCFSRLNFGKPKLWKEKKLFEINTHDIGLQISFDVKEAASNFVKGLFLEQKFFLGDKFNGIDFRVAQVTVLDEPDFDETMNYRLQTPWVVSYRPEGRKHALYLSPDDEMFHELALKHLTEKFKNIHNKEIPPDLLGFAINGSFKRSGFTLKPGSPDQTRVIGNLFNFQLTAPKELHQMIWNAGVSEKSSSGFGWVDIAPQQNNNLSPKKS
ncbi:CRISPR-associated endoribonuclease Cas6 [Salinivirga cyanobacteriivorans]|uniref:CRISPR-associated endoribonuclease Cas6 n=1 Tax=Salinivirga cyanobacteriivorans TaxID=1307839 RepID=A0A0S2I3M5_9BACT|nr:CRISPR-associated endoribonuclease Cas6 [Salinivirga cyanobacteriivorans]ALO17049.1 CRISPR-associated endoribonuclease Cas6 [Salinivirga cyanobacteriivorans]